MDGEVVLVVLFAEDGAIFGAGADDLVVRLEVEFASGGPCCTVVPSMLQPLIILFGLVGRSLRGHTNVAIFGLQARALLNP